MNVVGRVGSLISQGVYSVATPFHPFGGAVDIIVVQQQDGTFRSTPWYVRFGKFQGVLKGAEKIVGINVNGVEANFHMCLENSGEAYFLREDVSSEEIQAKEGATIGGETIFSDSNSIINCSQHVSSSKTRVVETMISTSEQTELKNWSSSYVEHVSEQGGKQYFEFSEFQSEVGASVELTEFRSNGCGSFNNMEHLMDSQDSDSEVVLFSVDGHVLTAPVLSSEDDTQNLQLYTPQFHLGPGEGDEFCEGNTGFDTREETWATDYISKLEESSNNKNTYASCSISIDQSGVCDEIVDDIQEIKGGVGHVVEIEARSGGSSMNFVDSVSNVDGECATSVVDTDCLSDDHCDKDCRHTIRDELCVPNEITSPQGSFPKSIEAVGLCQSDEIVDPTVEGSSSPHHHPLASNGLITEAQTEERSSLGAENMEDSVLITVPTGEFDGIAKEFEITAQERDGVGNDVASPSEEDVIYVHKVVEHGSASSQRDEDDANVGLEISVCGGKLFDGMGLREATEEFDAHRVSEDEFKNSASYITKNENLVVRYKGSYLRWEKAAQIVLGLAAFGLELPIDYGDVIRVEGSKAPEFKDNTSEIPLESSSRRWRLWPIPFRRVKTMKNTSRNSSNEGNFVVSDSNSQNMQTESSMLGNDILSPHKEFVKTNIPTTEQIASLNLKEGQNIITFSFSTRVLGMQEVDAHIYLWMWNAQIVISDVDGTITRSDVLGQFMPLVGRDWSQFGVTQLFSAIRENGYQLLFLSARAIVQAYLTRSFLLNLKQDGKALPNGPVVISPDGLFPSLYREVIRRAPHEFKIACLQDIKALFPVGYNPFYAGFGNRDTDELSYRKIGIPKGKIFIINPKGEVAINNRVDVKSYTSLHTLVNDMFPPASLVEQEDFNSWNFWKMPLSCIDVNM